MTVKTWGNYFHEKMENYWLCFRVFDEWYISMAALDDESNSVVRAMYYFCIIELFLFDLLPK